MLANELADLGDAGVIPHLEHGASDLVLLLELGETLIGVFVHGAELPHAEGRQAAVRESDRLGSGCRTGYLRFLGELRLRAPDWELR